MPCASSQPRKASKNQVKKDMEKKSQNTNQENLEPITLSKLPMEFHHPAEKSKVKGQYSNEENIKSRQSMKTKVKKEQNAKESEESYVITEERGRVLNQEEGTRSSIGGGAVMDDEHKKPSEVSEQSAIKDGIEYGSSAETGDGQEPGFLARRQVAITSMRSRAAS